MRTGLSWLKTESRDFLLWSLW